MSTGSGAPEGCPPPGRRPSVAATAGVLAVSAAVLVAALGFLFLVVPRTHVRAAKPSAELADRLALWRLADRLPGESLAGGRLLAALAAAVVAAFAAYLVAVLAARRAGSRRALLAVAVGVSALCVAASTLALPNLDTDVYTYIGTGRVAAVHHRDPYRHATDRFPHDPFLRYAEPQYTHYPDVKLPAWMPLDVGLAWVAGNDPVRALLVYRGAFAGFDLGALALVLLVVRRLRPERLVEAAVAWGWCPLVGVFGQSKVDVVMVFLLLVGLLLLLAAQRTAAVAALTLSALVKLLTAPYLVALWANELRVRGIRAFLVATAAVGAIAAVLYSPYSRPLQLLVHHLSLVQEGGSDTGSPARALAALVGVAAAVWVGRRASSPEGLVPLFGVLGLVLGALALPAEYPWYLLTTVALVAVTTDRRLVGAAAAVGAVSLVVYERRSNSTPRDPLPSLAPVGAQLVLAAVGLLVVAAVAAVVVRRRRVARRPASIPAGAER